MLLLLMLMLLVLLPVPSWAVTYYMSTTGSDSNPCTGAGGNNAQNPAFARQNAPAAVACLGSGDTLMLKGGTYVNQCFGDFVAGSVTPIPPGLSAATPTTIRNAPGETVQINATTQCAGGNAPITMDNVASQHIVFDGINIRGTGTFQLMVLGSSHIRYRNMVLSHGREAIAGAPSENIFENVTVQYSGYNASFVDVCPVPDLGCHGVYFYGGINNRFIRLISRGATGMGVVMSCDGCPDQPEGNLVEQAQLYDNHNAGFHARPTNMLRNSVLYRNYNAGGGQAELYNNTVVDNTNTELFGGTVANIGIYTYGASPQQVRNNIAVNNPDADILSQVSGATYTNNVCGALDSTYGCAIASTPAALFVNAAARNYHLKSGAPAINAGVTLTEVTDDMDGQARPAGNYDVGADEFGSPIVPGNTNPIFISPTGSDDNDCSEAETEATPKQTIANALACMTEPGKTLVFLGGTYPGHIDTSLVPFTGGTGSTVRTTFRGKAGVTAILQLPALGTYAGVVRLVQASDSWLHFDNLTLDAMHRPESTAVSIEAGSNTLWTNLTIRNAAYQLFLVYGGAGNVELRDSTLHTSAITCVLLDGAIGSITLTHNTINNCQEAAFENTNSPSASLTLTRNTFFQAGLAGTNPVLDLRPTSNAALINNIFYASNAGVRLRSGATGTLLYHNTVHAMTNFGLQCDSGATGTVATNNISVGNGSNVANNCGATLAGNVQTGAPSTIFVNPGANNYQLLAGSPAINTGSNLPAVPQDIALIARPQGPFWDAGAHEYVPTPGPAVALITTPVSTPTYSTDTTPLTSLGGTASDETGVVGVAVSCSPSCGSPTVSCASCGVTATSVTWTVASLPLTDGLNVLTVTPHDATGPGTTDTLTVTKTVTPTPPVPTGPAATLFFF